MKDEDGMMKGAGVYMMSKEFGLLAVTQEMYAECQGSPILLLVVAYIMLMSVLPVTYSSTCDCHPSEFNALNWGAVATCHIRETSLSQRFSKYQFFPFTSVTTAFTILPLVAASIISASFPTPFFPLKYQMWFCLGPL